MTSSDQTTLRGHEGTLDDGTKYLIHVPADWNGSLLLYSYGPPQPPEAPAWLAEQPLVQALLARGFALAGCGTTRFWPLEQNIPNQLLVAGLFEELVGLPERTIAWGQSIGGLMTAALVQNAPDRLDGALILCGTLGGGIGTHNQQLDCMFVFKTLLAPDSSLELVLAADPGANVALAYEILESAQTTPEGRARLALAAAMANIPGWFDPHTPQPPADDPEARQREQYRWFEHVDLHVFLEARAVLERRGEGNPSWNTGVDYRELLAGSINRDQVVALYEAAGVDLEADLDVLAREPRIAADTEAVAYFERYIAFDGRLGGVPVIGIHQLGDGLVPVDHEWSYRDVVEHAGDEELLRQLYVSRGGHCFFTTAEVLAAFDGLLERVETGVWPDLAPVTLNAAAEALGPDHNTLPPIMSAWMPDQAGHPVAPAFVDFAPPAMARTHDTRHIR